MGRLQHFSRCNFLHYIPTVRTRDSLQQVYSPFELNDCKPASLGLSDVPNVCIIDWESLDCSLWATCKALLLLPTEVIEASMKIPFSREKHVSQGSIYCGKHCDKSLTERDKKNNDAEVETATSFSNEGMSAHPDTVDTELP